MPLRFLAAGGAHIIVLTSLKPAGFPKDTDLGLEMGGFLNLLCMLRAEYVIIIRVKKSIVLKNKYFKYFVQLLLASILDTSASFSAWAVLSIICLAEGKVRGQFSRMGSQLSVWKFGIGIPAVI